MILTVKKLFLAAAVAALSAASATANIIEINDGWKLRQARLANSYPATVPGCVHTDLMANGIIENPYYRLNERNVQWIDKEDWEYTTTVWVDSGMLSDDRVMLECDGLDTYCDVSVNGTTVIKADNMFRRWEADVKHLLREGNNDIKVYFHSPVKIDLPKWEADDYHYMAMNDQSENGGLLDRKISVYARKAGYHYGWDWGPRLVTSGIWRPMRLHSWSDAIIDDVFINQKSVTGKKAEISHEVTVEASGDIQGAEVIAKDADTGKVLARKKVDLTEGRNDITLPVTISNPRLWWCNGLGKPEMYTFETLLINGSDTLSVDRTRTGLRSLEVVNEPDKDGMTLYFKLNGVPVFAKGANYIPQDMFLPRVTDNDYRRTIADAKDANMNMLRVWGGGIYENDIFYEFCDENGIMVWQDFMFACSMYPAEGALLDNIREEAIDNVVRLRNHPSIALWCGSNECFVGWKQWGWKDNMMSQNPEAAGRMDRQFHRQYFEVLPEVVEKYHPGISYRASSPYSGSMESCSDNCGDTHYWGVWHSMHPTWMFNNVKSRFFSEYGFQSFPEYESVKLFTNGGGDLSLTSDVVQAHQRGGSWANSRIMDYLLSEYREPKDFKSFLYANQVLQGDAIKTAIESHRRQMPYCMGTLYWQHNDCWPMASWAARDYYGRWKAQHYFARKAFKSTIVTGAIHDGILSVHTVSDNLRKQKGVLDIRLLDFNGNTLKSFSKKVDIDPNTSAVVWSSPVGELLGGLDGNDCFVNVKLSGKEGVIDSNNLYFNSFKELNLPQVNVSAAIAEADGGYDVTLSADRFARAVFLSINGIDNFFSDNYFDIIPGEDVTVRVTTTLPRYEFERQLSVMTLTDACRYPSSRRSHTASCATYPQSYGEWAHSLMSGNGNTGFLLFGNPTDETVVMCDRNYNFPSKGCERSFAKVNPDTIAKIKQLCADGKFSEANHLAVSSSEWRDGGKGGRHPGFVMNIRYNDAQKDITGYRRAIDYSTGEITVSWSDSAGEWSRRAFTSFAGDYAMLRLDAPDSRTLDATVRLMLTDDMHFPEGTSWRTEPLADGIAITVTYPDGVNSYSGTVKVHDGSGYLAPEGDSIKITGVNSATVIVSTRDISGAGNDYAAEFMKHCSIYSPIFSRASISFDCDSDDAALPNEQLLAKQRALPEANAALLNRLFDAGRHTFLSSSSSVTAPDLLGIWTGDCNVGWGGFYHLDANLNLQISGGNIGAMPEAMEGYFNLHDSWLPGFRKNASDLLGVDGLVACGNTPGLGDGLMASINDDYPYHWSTGEEPWLLYPYWEHYLVTSDTSFLRTRLFPLLKEMATFYTGFLTHKDADGKWIFTGSVSHENKPSNLNVSLLNNSSIDIAGARFIFDALFKSGEILGEDVSQWREFASHLPGYMVNRDGALAEWAWPGLDDNYAHRHTSHLVGVWPYREITPDNKPLAAAAKRALDFRNSFSFGNSAGHGVLMGALHYANLNDGKACGELLRKLAGEDYYFNGLASAHFPDHGVFCTDVANTFPAILMEMLVGSTENTITLLPALPASLPGGTLSGILTRTGVKVESMSWSGNGIDCRLYSPRDCSIELIAPRERKSLTLAAGTYTDLHFDI